MLLVLPTGHPLISRHTGRGMPRIALQELRDEQFVLVRRGGAPGMYADLVEACQRAGFTPRVAVEVDRMLTNISLVAAGTGVSAVPASMRGFHEGSVVYCSIADGGLAAQLTLACRAADPPPTLANFLQEAGRLAGLPLTPA
jgi:DNA-binding transcriptional LysR family regulator